MDKEVLNALERLIKLLTIPMFLSTLIAEMIRIMAVKKESSEEN